ncbi:hypothetical protein BN1723_006792 [Verticillium longisporum]|uniref:polynucleotide adenylyltransferase n=1 Tax=Verticillium longisporum TaxID=100787 RepID=A0A0G4NHS3_VERLO|nr:hypothetical protein BN1723_006792 [Verticillium longisporum]
MASQATATEETHSYYSSASWHHHAANATAPVSGTPPLTAKQNSQLSWTKYHTSAANPYPESSGVHNLTHGEVWPLWFPHQASLYQAQVLHYSNLISPGRGGGLHQPQSLPPSTVATPSQSQSAGRSRASSKVSNKEHPSSKGNEKGHGNKAANNKDKGDRAVIAGRVSPTMANPKQSQHSQGEHLSHPLPARPRGGHKHAIQPHSNSVPSTPQQHARNFSYESREPSPTANNNHSPRSAYSETNSALPSLRPLVPTITCKFETSSYNFKRRMPYNIGSGVCEKVDAAKIKTKLTEEHERKLTSDMRELYDRLLPTPKVEENRQKLVAKLQKIFNDEWPGHDIRVHLFGSSGNLLCSDDSDVDICITTTWAELEGVCKIAELLHKKGMEKVVWELLFQFFRYYAHEFDYDKHVLSVRQGKKLLRSEKKWANNLCVEEPFNIGRNLGNTADEYSFRGLHLELRRAFDCIAEAKLDECCEQYVFPKEEQPPPFIRPPNAPRPVMIRSSSQSNQSGRGGRGNYRGGRHSNNYRSGNSSRRASSGVAYDTNTMYMPQNPMTPQEVAWYQHAAAQQLQYPGILFNQSQVLQMQAQMAAQLHAHQRMQGGSSTPQQQSQQSQQGSSERSRTNSFENPPLSAPLAASDWYSMYNLQLQAFYGAPAYTYPPSPATTSAAGPEYRRQRSTMAADSGASTSGSSLRSQSQPASRSAPQGQPGQPFSGSAPQSNGIAGPRLANGVSIPSFTPEDADYDAVPRQPNKDSPASDEGTYAGYYVADASSPNQRAQPIPNGIAFGDLAHNAQGRRRLSTDQIPQTLLDRRLRRKSRSPSPSPLGHARAYSIGTQAGPSSSAPMTVPANPSNGNRSAARPLVVNGTGSSAWRASSTPSHRQGSSNLSVTDNIAREDNVALCPDNVYNLPGLGISTQHAPAVDLPLAVTADVARSQSLVPETRTPVIVNGSTNVSTSSAAAGIPIPGAVQSMEDASFRDRINLMGLANYQTQQAAFQSDAASGVSTSTTRQRLSTRQHQNGVIAPLDLAVREGRSNGHPLALDPQHLSPINETRSPSPTTVRKLDHAFKTDITNLPRSGTMDSLAEPFRPGQALTEQMYSSAKEQSQLPVTGQGAARTSAAPSGHPLQVSLTPNQIPPFNPKLGDSRENGHTRGAKSESHSADGAWQKATKGRKKGGDGRVAAPSEQPPRSGEDRKGG